MKNSKNHLALALSGALSLAAANTARAEISDNVVRVGVLNDISGIFQDTNGMPICCSRVRSRRRYNGQPGADVNRNRAPFIFPRPGGSTHLAAALRDQTRGALVAGVDP